MNKLATIELQTGPGVWTLSLNRPDSLNAITKEMVGELNGALDKAEDAEECRILVLTGSGRASFAGSDTMRALTRFWRVGLVRHRATRFTSSGPAPSPDGGTWRSASPPEPPLNSPAGALGPPASSK